VLRSARRALDFIQKNTLLSITIGLKNLAIKIYDIFRMELWKLLFILLVISALGTFGLFTNWRKPTSKCLDRVSTLRDYLYSVKDDWNYITPIDFYNEYYLKKKDYFLIDLRTEKEYKKMHIKGSNNIFWLNILDEENLKKLPKDKPIFLICYVGHTSSQVLTLLKMLGYNVISIKYGYGLSPVKDVPVAGWLDYGLPTESSQ
jgi:rhodanese-related sulfurtransferase